MLEMGNAGLTGEAVPFSLIYIIINNNEFGKGSTD